MRYFADKIIKTYSWEINTGSYSDIVVSNDAPERTEPLVMLQNYGIHCNSFYARRDGKNWPYLRKISGALDDIWVRKGVAEKLFRVNQFLDRFNIELLVLDGYRPIECQIGLWNYFSEKIEIDNPGISQQQKNKLLIDLVSDPTRFSSTDPRTWPMHTTGGAVDLELRYKTSHQPLDMGSMFDEMGSIAYTDAYEIKLSAKEITQQDQRLINRRILYSVMMQEGFTNYPKEYWHFDFGNQMHTLISQLLKRQNAPSKAVYGYIDPPY